MTEARGMIGAAMPRRDAKGSLRAEAAIPTIIAAAGLGHVVFLRSPMRMRGLFRSMSTA